ncbi:MAG: molybdate ABC transporter substrate-binding protein [Pseudomonadota bacterium]
MSANSSWRERAALRTHGRRLLPALLLWIGAATGVQAETALVAVATNFAPALDALAAEFAAATPHRIRSVSGSTGKLYAQIERGAPFDVLLAADARRPALLEAQGRFAVAQTRFTYALGRLVLWSREPIAPEANLAAELSGARRLALANPRLAPYGLAATQTLASLGLSGALAPRLVYGENVGQAHALASTGNASHVLTARALAHGASLPVPVTLHEPIRQDAILLARGAANPAARAWLAYLRGAAGRACIRAHGYDVPERSEAERVPAA